MSKNTYKFWICADKWTDSKYYYFKTFKIYWAYRYWLAELGDKTPVNRMLVDGLPGTIYFRMADRFKL